MKKFGKSGKAGKIMATVLAAALCLTGCNEGSSGAAAPAASTPAAEAASTAVASSEAPAASSTAASSAASAEKKDVALTVWGPQEDQADDSSWLQTECKAFAAAHPEWNITFTYAVCSEGDAG